MMVKKVGNVMQEFLSWIFSWSWSKFSIFFLVILTFWSVATLLLLGYQRRELNLLKRSCQEAIKEVNKILDNLEDTLTDKVDIRCDKVLKSCDKLLSDIKSKRI
jgi:hypothetical protein